MCGLCLTLLLPGVCKPMDGFPLSISVLHALVLCMFIHLTAIGAYYPPVRGPPQAAWETASL